MYQNKEREEFRIDINLENGIYIFPLESATGKTFLKQKLNECRTRGENVITYDYQDYINDVSLKERLCKACEVILIDRYDMYKGEGIDAMKEYSDKSIILVDCKSLLNIPNEPCIMYLEKDRIKVEK